MVGGVVGLRVAWMVPRGDFVFDLAVAVWRPVWAIGSAIVDSFIGWV